MTNTSFIIRVYGIYVDDKQRVLVSDEIVKGEFITKFPGGGLEYGEGTIECLRREMREETDSDFEIQSHFYTTDFFLESAYHPNHQVICIYYLMKPVNEFAPKITQHPFEFSSEAEGEQSFRFIELKDLQVDRFTFPNDKIVARYLMQRNAGN